MAMDPKVKKQIIAICVLSPVFLWGVWDFLTVQTGWIKLGGPKPAAAPAQTAAAAPVAEAPPPSAPTSPPAAPSSGDGSVPSANSPASVGLQGWEQQSKMLTAGWGRNVFKPYIVKKALSKVEPDKASNEPIWPGEVPCPAIGNINGDYAFVESSLVTKGDKIGADITVVAMTKNSVTFKYSNGGRCTSTVEGF